MSNNNHWLQIYHCIPLSNYIAYVCIQTVENSTTDRDIQTDKDRQTQYYDGKEQSEDPKTIRYPGNWRKIKSNENCKRKRTKQKAVATILIIRKSDNQIPRHELKKCNENWERKKTVATSTTTTTVKNNNGNAYDNYTYSNSKRFIIIRNFIIDANSVNKS